MRQGKVMIVLLAVLLLASGVLGVNLYRLYQNVYYIPDTAVEDLCRVLEKDGILLDSSLIPRRREDGTIYVSDGTGYEKNAALLLAGNEIKSTYAIPDGQLFLHYNGDITEFTSGFRFRYRSGTAEGDNVLDSYDIAEYEALTRDMEVLSDTGPAAQAAMAFLDKQDEALGASVQVETVIASVRGQESGRAYVRCLRQIDGVEITENTVICLVEQGRVTEAAGRWCFMTIGESYVAQLSDITNILFTMKRTLQNPEEGTENGTGYRVTALERCYSLYFLSGNDGFCLIPCWRIETDRGGIMVCSALDGTLYTKIEEIT